MKYRELMNVVNIGNIGYKGDMLKKWKIGI